MKATGIVRSMDALGRIVIPVELRRVLEIEPEDALEIFSENNAIVLRKYQPSCIFCGEAKNISTFRGRNICSACMRELKVMPGE